MIDPPFLKVGHLYLTRDCHVVYEIIRHDPRTVPSCDQGLVLTDGFAYCARPCQITAPFRHLTGTMWPEQWYDRQGNWTRAPGQQTDIDLTLDIGKREDYLCPA